MSFAQNLKKKNKTFEVFVNFVIFSNNWAFVASNIILINKLVANIVSTYIVSAPWFLRDPNGIFWSITITLIFVFPSYFFYIFYLIFIFYFKK